MVQCSKEPRDEMSSGAAAQSLSREGSWKHHESHHAVGEQEEGINRVLGAEAETNAMDTMEKRGES
jgi:hypothetical protein